MSARSVPLRGPLLLTIVSLGALACVAAVLSLRGGIVSSPDGAISLSIADNLAQGRGFTTPVGFIFHGFSPREMVGFGDALPAQGFPPLHAALLAIGEASGGHGRGAAALLNIVGTTGGVVVIAIATAIMSRGSVLTVALVGVWTLTQSELLLITRFVQPEAFFLLLVASQALLVWRFVMTGRRQVLLACIVLTATAVLFRQLGLALIGSGMLAVLAFRDAPLRRRWAEATTFAVGALLPFAIYWPLSAEPGSSAGFTQFAVHPPGGEDYSLLYDTVQRWLVDPRTIFGSALIFWLLATAAVALAASGWRPVADTDDGSGTPTGRDRSERILAAVLSLTVVSSLAVLWLSSTFLDDDVEFGGRYLIPLQPLVFAVVGAGIARFVRPRARRLPALGPALAGVAVLALLPHVVTLTTEGLGFPALRVETSLAAAVEALPDHAPIFAEYPEGVYLATGRGAYILPSRIHRYTGQVNPDVDAELAELAELAAEGPVYVLVQNYPVRTYLVPIDDLRRVVALDPVAASTTETLYLATPRV